VWCVRTGHPTGDGCISLKVMWDGAADEMV
jgi:hypothetical protein